MKIIVCGAGVVGTGIARQLAGEDNHVTIVDASAELIQQIESSLDVTSVVGIPSHPNVLEEAGAEDAEMIIAVTTSDETNMVICQVAGALFGIPVKIARIRSQNYLQPAWKDLYRHDHLPIDFIISPEQEVANAIVNRLHVPGAMDSIPFAGGNIKVIEVRCTEKCPVIGLSIERIAAGIPDLKMAILAIKREEQFIVPSPKEILRPEDELFFIADVQHVEQAMALLGHKEREARRVVIIGAGNIGLYVAESLTKEEHRINTKLIELTRERAQYVATRLPEATVIQGDCLDREILFESNIQSAEMAIAVTNDDEVNILSCLMAKRYGCQRALALINKGRSYGPLVSSLGIDVTINPREMTVSSILQHIRRGKVLSAHAICGGMAEIIEALAAPHSSIIGKEIRDLNLPSQVRVGALYRNGVTIIPDEHTIIQENDRVITLAHVSQIHKVDKIFSARQDYF